MESFSINLAANAAAADVANERNDVMTKTAKYKSSKPTSSSSSSLNAQAAITKTANRHRNLSAYNFYMKYHRTVLVTPGMSFDALHGGLTFDQKRQHILQVLDDDPYRLKAGEKRLHRTSHGAIGFKELTRQVSTAWRSLDDDSRAVFQDIARESNRISREQYGEEETTKKITAPKRKAAKKKRKATATTTTSGSAPKRARSPISASIPTTTNSKFSSTENRNGLSDGAITAQMEQLLHQQFLLAKQKIESVHEHPQQHPGIYHHHKVCIDNRSNSMPSTHQSSGSIVSNGLPGSGFTSAESSFSSTGHSSSASLPFYAYLQRSNHAQPCSGGNATWYHEPSIVTVTAAPSRSSYASSTCDASEGGNDNVEEEEAQYDETFLTKESPVCNNELAAFLTKLDWSKL